MSIPEPPDLSIGKPQQIARGYRDWPKLRAIVEGAGGWLPGVTAINTYLVERLNQLERQRVEALYSYLDESGAVLTAEMVESDDFLHRFTITVKAAARTSRTEKIRLIARLLASAIKDADRPNTDVDEYEELLAILDDLSVREIIILTTLERFERQVTGITSGADIPDLDPQIVFGYWSDFIPEIEDQAGILHNEREAVLTRLNRTGLYETYRDLADGDGSATGHLTPRYYRLRALIADDSSTV